jgi:SAM-dependent methyltransferase
MARFWEDGDYGLFAERMLGGLGARLVASLAVDVDERVLDVACGVGNAAIPAAALGAAVTASDITPELVARGRAEAPGGIDWVVADAQDLPFPDAHFDVVMSCVGVIFAPRHAVAARELLRVCRPGGRIGLVTWPPESSVGELMRAIEPFVPPLPPGVEPVQRWGDVDHVRALLGDDVRDLRFDRGVQQHVGFESAAALLDFFRTTQGPTQALFRLHEDDPERTAQLEEAMLTAFGEPPFESEYLLVRATRR